MDDAPMDHALNASALAGGEMKTIPSTTAKTSSASPIPWDTYVRCLFLTFIVALAGYMAWSPGMLRLSILMSHVSPSRGDNLAWRPTEDATVFVQPAKRTPTTPEWRLKSTHKTSWTTQRPDILPSWRGGRMSRARWQRYSSNPWIWRNDHQSSPRREAELAGTPVQKPPTSFRSTEREARFDGPATEPVRKLTPTLAIPPLTPATSESSTPAPSSLALVQIPALMPPEAPRLSAAPGVGDNPTEPGSSIAIAEPVKPTGPDEPIENVKPTQPSEPVESVKPVTPDEPKPSALIPSAVSADNGATAQAIPAIDESLRPAQSPVPSAVAPTTVPEMRREPTVSVDAAFPPAQSIVSTANAAAPEQALPPRMDSTEAARPTAPAAVENTGETDWKDQEITGPIAEAYLTIYPKLRFVGLCVPGQGYIRKYYQVAVPEDLVQPKMSGQDGRTPYGRYYVAGRATGGGGSSLYLSWPSPDDANRIGLDPAVIAAVGNAWAVHTLPPQTTLAGGGVTISAQHGSADATTGGFALEKPQMEELFTALPDGAWVFIQE